MPVIRLAQVTKRFAPDVTALRSVDLAIHAGELIVIVGPSGSGKSTLLRLIAGLDTPTTGQILLGDRDAARLSPAARQLGMVFQGDNLLPHLNVCDNLSFGLRMRKATTAEVRRRVAEIADLLGLDELLDRWPHEISGGEQQRVSLGRALVTGAELLLLDEPLSNVDPARRTELRSAIRDVHRQMHKTVLYVTHDQAEALTMGDRMAVLHAGVLQQVDTPRTIYDRPANRFVASFIGSPPMNLVTGSWHNGALHALGNAHRTPAPSEPGPVTIGIRPEDLQPALGAPYCLTGTIAAIDYLGHETLARLQMPDGHIVCRLPGSFTCRVGERLTLGYELAALHRFATDGTRV